MATAEFWLEAVMSLVIFILSLTIHEYAHAFVAFRLGDDTASRQGRLTLNPIPHIDPIGTILMPIIGSAGIPVIGWARPVPVNPVRFSRRLSMRAGHALVSVAGPASNVLLALLCTGLLAVVQHTGLLGGQAAEAPIETFLSRMLMANIGLAIFNLLPVPPLDGSKLLPRSLDAVTEVLARYSFFVFIAIIVFGRRVIWVPVAFLANLLVGLFGVDLRFH